jgi:hypothetical protein
MRILAALLSLSVAVLFAQASSGARKRSRGRADAGPSDGGTADARPVLLGPDPPGRLRADPPGRDGGVPAIPPPGGSDAGTTQAQILELRARISTLEQQAAASQQQTQQMAAMNDQLQALRDQLAAADAQRQQQQQDTLARQQAVQSAVSSLVSAQQQLAGGDAAIGDALNQAQSAFTGQAQRDVQAAQVALRNGDLAAARAYLSSAVSNAQQGH